MQLLLRNKLSPLNSALSTTSEIIEAFSFISSRTSSSSEKVQSTGRELRTNLLSCNFICHNNSQRVSRSAEDKAISASQIAITKSILSISNITIPSLLSGPTETPSRDNKYRSASKIAQPSNSLSQRSTNRTASLSSLEHLHHKS